MIRQPKLLAFGLLILILISCQTQTSKQTTETTEPEYSEQFFYYAKPPVNGTKLGVIVIGGSGFDAFAIDVDKEKNWKLIFSKYAESKVIIDQIDLNYMDSLLAVRRSEIAEFGVAPKNIKQVLSSTAVKSAHLMQVIGQLRARGYQFEEIDEDSEALYAFKASVPAEFVLNSFAMDIGSGNTKFSWQENGKMETRDTYGSRYDLAGVQDSTVALAVSAIMADIPASLKQNCFLIGGAAYELAKLNNEYTDRYSVLKEFSKYEPQSVKAKNGLVILKAADSVSDVKNFIFDWESNFGIGYLLSLP